MFHFPTLKNIFSKQHGRPGYNLEVLKSLAFHTRMWQHRYSWSPKYGSWPTSLLFLPWIFLILQGS